MHIRNTNLHIVMYRNQNLL